MNKIFSFLKKLAPVAIIMFFLLSTNIMGQEKATYLVKQGDTLYGISKKLDVTIAELKQWNNISGNEIELGQELIYYLRDESVRNEELPEEPSNPLVTNSSGNQNVIYVVKSGDTLFRIARTHNMSLEELKSLNNLTDNNIRIGQELAVKKLNEAPPSVARFSEESSPQGVFSVYEVKRGDSFAELLTRFKMTEDEFKKLNPELNSGRLPTGQDVTVLLPPSRNYENPYLQKANLQDLGEVRVNRYDDSEFGETTTNGELYDPEALTAAHSNIALGSIIFVENVQTGNGVYVRINDRITGAGLKLSHRAFSTLRLNQATQPAVTIYTEVND
ncbi:MAG: LysM peptidoglycan-binding domain-containing protein [Gracilimonas sp.]|uniref:LysM peptidoglycan-binding domain-containing protein n=1 Tax=Gracilimonas sp. TaxID=1974203 RepID=UPI00199357FD|nr:LysM peptidoglycan-binding domain-containing protein [Gracilimonas sp.]MBD3617309.1 LysM peptidoglycan-binding domain-containing protein [Gracilimonas sp.]